MKNATFDKAGDAGQAASGFAAEAKEYLTWGLTTVKDYGTHAVTYLKEVDFVALKDQGIELAQ